MFKGFWRTLIVILIIILITVIGSVNYVVNKSTAQQLYTDAALIPKSKVGLLLGTAKFKDKGKHIVNSWYQNRIDAAVKLYMAGKIDFIIVSGDSATYYNEPALMKADLVAQGIPPNKIYMDNAGFRTLDSILRCRDIFNEDHITIISQEFHNERALFIANHKQVAAIAFNAADGDSYLNVFFREKLARVKMIFDLVLNTQAKYYGEHVVIK